MNTRVWGFQDKLWGGPAVFVPVRCMRMFSTLVILGLWVTLAAVLAVFYTARCNLRSHGAEGSLVLPTVIALGVFSGVFVRADVSVRRRGRGKSPLLAADHDADVRVPGVWPRPSRTIIRTVEGASCSA